MKSESISKFFLSSKNECLLYKLIDTCHFHHQNKLINILHKHLFNKNNKVKCLIFLFFHSNKPVRFPLPINAPIGTKSHESPIPFSFFEFFF